MENDQARMEKCMQLVCGAMMQNLINCFKINGRFVTAEALAGWIPIKAEVLVKHGWLIPARLGRWSQGYAPAGELLDLLTLADPERGANPVTLSA